MTEAGRIDLDAVEAVIPNLKRRYSGVTATNRTIAPLIAGRCEAVWFGPDRPDGIAGLSLLDLVRLRFRPPKGRRARIWHARRNTEMLLGLVLKGLGFRLKLVFTSAGQRRKTAYTNFLIARMDAVIATSAVSASFVERPATVIHHGVDLDLYKPPADRAAEYAATGLPGRYGIATFGRVRKQKGSDLFVEAMCRLLPKYPDFAAVIVGHVSADNAQFVDRLKGRAAAAGLSERIRFLGERPIEEVPLWYRRVSITVFASRVEGFGLTLLEAMAAENAVIATRAGAAELVIDDGDTGFLAPVDDVDALAAAIEPMMRAPERIPTIGARARVRIARDFSREREADEIVAVYRRVWEGAGAGGANQASAASS
ncbi:mannosyltransferase [Roseiarcus fermentans]|uniref:Mannosyltransferase n=1 Tax=Roseiarcus fermentans TaxID=1473586 RepID=A0A366FJF3_9HYPH|nr:glycosyltransferase family 4 protein [Roseiarcus fermentans]RBP13839.1 mannosyltransferase [Roseiarcus fermentans]